MLVNSAYSNTWQDVTAGYPTIDSQVFSSICDGGTGVVFAGSWAAGGIYRTTDNGTTWAQISTMYNFESLLIDPNTPTTLWGTNWNSSEMVEESLDALDPAITLQDLQTGMTATSTHSIKIVGGNSSQLLVATTMGTYRTVNAGLNWTGWTPQTRSAMQP